MSDRLRLEVFHHLFAATAEEMGVSLMRSAFSAAPRPPNGLLAGAQPVVLTRPKR